MKRLLPAILMFGTFNAEAQYAGRSGVRYLNNGNVFTVRRSRDWSPDRRDGRCTIRVRIDDESDVELRGDQVRIRVIRGRPGRDEGSVCNAPLPTSGNIRNFRFRGIGGRGSQRLVQEPASRNFYVAVVNVEDPRSGDAGYTFDLGWNWDGAGGGSNRPTPPPPGRPPGGSFPGSLPDMNQSIAGFGTLNDGGRRLNLTDATVRVNRQRCQIVLISDRGDRLDMSGTVARDTSRCIIDSSNRGRTSGNAYVQLAGPMVRSVSVSGNINGRNFSADFSSGAR